MLVSANSVSSTYPHLGLTAVDEDKQELIAESTEIFRTRQTPL